MSLSRITLPQIAHLINDFVLGLLLSVLSGLLNLVDLGIYCEKTKFYHESYSSLSVYTL